MLLDGSADEESVCNAGDLGSFPGLGDPLEEGTVTHSGILAPHGQRSLVGCSLWGCRELDTTERLSTQHNWK